MKNFTEKEVKPILKSLKERNQNILYEVWALNYHMNTQRSETLLMTPDEREFWLNKLIEQREKENEEIKKATR